uniref:Uncharacterized protein n=1 Tax=Caenorhabditis japonica TaxID=281687 RepID=A0A8R1IKG7_CAEJA
MLRARVVSNFIQSRSISPLPTAQAVHVREALREVRKPQNGSVRLLRLAVWKKGIDDLHERWLTVVTNDGRYIVA